MIQQYEEFYLLTLHNFLFLPLDTHDFVNAINGKYFILFCQCYIISLYFPFGMAKTLVQVLRLPIDEKDVAHLSVYVSLSSLQVDSLDLFIVVKYYNYINECNMLTNFIYTSQQKNNIEGLFLKKVMDKFTCQIQLVWLDD